MAGIYIHIPFCRKACTYCDFHFVTGMKRRGEMAAAICRELELQRNFFAPETLIHTVYFGGGTPSVLTDSELRSILDAVYAQWSIHPDAEITLEANPDDLTADKLAQLRAAGINRLSVGVQSFDEEDLRWMNRSHSALQARQSIRDAQAAGFRNFTLDLIFGLPGRSAEDWKRNLLEAVSLEAPHLSLYALTVEEKTALGWQVQQKKVQLPEDESFGEQFLLAHDLLTAAGYEHYELSNYAKPGFRSQHNTSYWEGKPYLGVGPSAHSYDPQSRSWNLANNSGYLRRIAEGSPATEAQETLSPQEQYHEYIMTQLRRHSGIDARHIETRWMPGFRTRFARLLDNCCREGLMQADGDIYRLTPRGWLVSDRIIRDFF